MGSPEPTFEISYHRSSVGHLSIRLSVYLVVCISAFFTSFYLVQIHWDNFNQFRQQIFFYLIGGYTVYTFVTTHQRALCTSTLLIMQDYKNNWNQNFWHFHIYLVEGIIKSYNKMELDDLLMSKTQEKGTSYET